MAYEITDVKNDLTRMFRGTTLNKVQNMNALLWTAGRKVLARTDPAPTRRTAQITIYDGLYNYSAPADLKGNKVLDIRPQVNRSLRDNISQRHAREFDQRRLDNTFHVWSESGTKRIRIKKLIDESPTTIHNMDGIATNGTWAATANATNLTRDTEDFVDGSASLNFDLSSGGAGATGFIQNSDMAQIDLTTHDEISSIFVYVYIPDSTIITNFILRWGNDISNYWSRTVTVPFDRSAFQNGWNLLQFAWNGATETGTVDPAKIDYFRFTVTYNGTAETDIRVDKIFSALGKIWEIEYYSEFMFRTAAGVWQEEVTADDNVVNLDTESYNLFLWECALEGVFQIGDENAKFDVDKLMNDLRDAYLRYDINYPTEAQKPRGYYYRLR